MATSMSAEFSAAVTTAWRRGRRVGLFEGVLLGLLVGGALVGMAMRFT
jgi:hypothetical protein